MNTSFSNQISNSFTVTLISGDKVFNDVNNFKVMLAKREVDHQIKFIRVEQNNDLYIYPTDFLPYVSKVLDKQLFNMTQLKAYGYHDERMSYIPLIIMLTQKMSDADIDFFNHTFDHVLTVNHVLRSINA